MKFMVFIFHCDELILLDYKKKASRAFFNFIFNLGKFSTKEKKNTFITVCIVIRGSDSLNLVWIKDYTRL